MRFIQIIQKVTLSFFHNIKNFNIMKIGKITALSSLLIIATLISVFVFKNYVGSDNTIVEENQQIISMQKGDLISEVSISGQLQFSTNEDLLFTSTGKISKIHAWQSLKNSEWVISIFVYSIIHHYLSHDIKLIFSRI